MAVRLNSYLSFDGNAREAAEYYKTVFGGEVYLDTFAKFVDKMPVADADKDKVMHAYLKGNNGIELMFSDTMTGMPFQPGGQVSLTVNGDDEQLLRSYWDKLSSEGTITMPLDKAPWGDTFGMLTDKFGINWMIDILPSQH